ncbi:Uncharacterised protein [Escherichia coli]|nr:Uncharacterised protein [Escherichia coli]
MTSSVFFHVHGRPYRLIGRGCGIVPVAEFFSCLSSAFWLSDHSFPGLLKTQRAEKLVRLLFRFVDGGKQRESCLLQVKLHYLWGRTLMIILIMVNSFTVTGKLQTVIRQGIDDQLTVVS